MIAFIFFAVVVVAIALFACYDWGWNRGFDLRGRMADEHAATMSQIRESGRDAAVNAARLEGYAAGLDHAGVNWHAAFKAAAIDGEDIPDSPDDVADCLAEVRALNTLRTVCSIRGECGSPDGVSCPCYDAPADCVGDPDALVGVPKGTNPAPAEPDYADPLLI